MKKLKFIKLLILCLSVSCIASAKADDEIIFSEKYNENKVLNGALLGKDCGLMSITIRFDLSYNKNSSSPMYSKTNSAVLLSQGNTITLAGIDRNISRIEFEYASRTSSIDKNSFILSSGKYELSENIGVWTGDDQTVVLLIARNTFDKSNKLIKSIKITYGTLKSDSGLSFGDKRLYSIFENEKFTLPDIKMTEDYTGEFSYYSSDKDVAVVDENGNVEITGRGLTTITAVGTSTDTHNGGFCSIDLDVKCIVPSGIVLYESFDHYNGEGGNDNLWSGELYHQGNVLIEGWTIKEGACAYKCLMLGTSSSNGSVTTPSVKIYKNKPYILKFRAGAWNTSDESTLLNISSTTQNILQQKSVVLNKAEFMNYSIPINSSKDGEFKITFSGEKDKKSRLFLDEVQVIDPNITISSARYAVYVTPMDIDFTKTTGVTAYKVTDVNSFGAVLKKVLYAPAKTPLIIEGDAGTYELKEFTGSIDNIVNNQSENIEDNLLLPANGEICGDGSTIYSLSNIAGKIGFYKVKSGLKIPTGKAYIVIPEAQEKEYMPFIGTTTGIETVQTDLKTNDCYYDIQGLKVSTLMQGLYIKNGRKIVIK